MREELDRHKAEIDGLARRTGAVKKSSEMMSDVLE